ncbi:LysR family transcriptional regulator [Acidovorax sp. NCPPB 4044]|uniref:LysR family transcriptional regulator n=1 Tax=Acidovorax sp. NCPPB 4044 TaxID=2940490 RepID=UPI002303E497|nr:LysR family transcriptional regulator [Acidovorax sp. NCPPB 4044]MDA8520158.1 LysR family transcriptional regulator [Acidovorax sp. NCPPB 4044]
MLTIKQIQTFYWVARLGTLNKAAEKLHITQSAATKRLQEVEVIAAVPLFERGGRKSALTTKGRELMRECEQLFLLLDEMDLLKGTAQQPARLVHVGLTELTALTWFGRFIKEMKKIYPSVTIQPALDLSSLLRQRVENGQLDFAILPDSPPMEGMTRMRLGAVPFGWFAAPGTFAPDVVHPLRELAAYTVIEQSANSIITELCAQLWENAGVEPERIYGGNNVNALAGLIAAGVGISCLPVAMFRQEIERGQLQLLKTRPAAPQVPYHFCFLKHLHSALGYGVASIAKRSFSLSHEAS